MAKRKNKGRDRALPRLKKPPRTVKLFGHTFDSPTICSEYSIPDGYIPWESLRFHMAAVDLCDRGLLGKNGKILEVPEPVRDKTKWSDYDFPFFLVKRDLLDMLNETDALSDIDIFNECPFPFPHFQLLLPKGSLVLPAKGGIDVAAIEVGNWRDDVVEEIGKCKSFIMHAYAHDGSRAGLGEHFIGTGYAIDGKLNHQISDELFRDDQKDSESNRMLLDIVYKILTAMSAEPELVEPDEIERMKTGLRWNEPDIYFRVPKKIGFKVRYEGTGESGNGTRVQHWRRGHFRRQRFGKDRMDVRVIWIRPILINAYKTN